MLRKLLISYFILAVLSIVSANSCEDKSEIKFQKPYYLRFNKGFFYV